MLKLIVSSATYLQSSEITPEALERDPQNLLLSRGPALPPRGRDRARPGARTLGTAERRRCSGRASIRRSRTGFGAPPSTANERIRPRPAKTATAAGSMCSCAAPPRTRAWPRSMRPIARLCTMRRIRTNTPLQAFVTLNDPAYVEMAQALARRLAAEGGNTPGGTPLLRPPPLPAPRSARRQIRDTPRPLRNGTRRLPRPARRGQKSSPRIRFTRCPTTPTGRSKPPSPSSRMSSSISMPC